MKQALVHDFIVQHKLGVLGTLSPVGKPQSALVGIGVTPDLEIVFDTVDTSRKYRNLRANPACSFVIGWSGERTVQYEGEAHQPTGDALARFQEAYFAAWPDGPDRMAWPGLVYFAVTPKWVRYSDYDQAPPMIREFDQA